MIQVFDGLLVEPAEQNKKNLEARPDRRSLRREDDWAGSPLHLLRELGMEGEIICRDTVMVLMVDSGFSYLM